MSTDVTSQPVVVELPRELYSRVAQHAADRRRSIAQELITAAQIAYPAADDLPADINEAMQAMMNMSDTALWEAARRWSDRAVTDRVAELNDKAKNDGLTADEAAERTRLGHDLDRQMLVKAQAAVLLKRRGFDISSLGPQ